MKLKPVLIVLLCALLFNTGFAQIHVDEDQDVGIGIANTTDSRMDILNNTNEYTVRLTNNRTSDNDKYGIHSSLQVNGAGEPCGIYNSLTNNGGENGTGIATFVTEEGAGSKVGIRNAVFQNATSSAPSFGVISKVDCQGAGLITGIFSKIKPNGTGVKTNFKSSVTQASDSPNEAYGLDNFISSKSNLGADAYAIRNQIFPDAGSTGDNYGSYNYIDDAGTGTHYGVYSEVPATSGYAGYFLGNVVINGVSTPSDKKFKKNIKDIGDCSEIIKKIQPRRYNFKKSTIHKGSDREQYGFIAQEMEAILPGLVRTIEHPSHEINYEEQEDPDGEKVRMPVSKKGQKETYKAIDYTGLIPIMMQALKEQQTQIEKQQKEIAQLIEKVKKLSE